jgi:hypothetical protein
LFHLQELLESFGLFIHIVIGFPVAFIIRGKFIVRLFMSLILLIHLKLLVGQINFRRISHFLEIKFLYEEVLELTSNVVRSVSATVMCDHT